METCLKTSQEEQDKCFAALQHDHKAEIDAIHKRHNEKVESLYNDIKTHFVKERENTIDEFFFAERWETGPCRRREATKA